MNGHENLEAELRRLRPAAPPAEFMARLAEISSPVKDLPKVSTPQTSVIDIWRQMLRWFVPTTAGIGFVVAALIWAGKTRIDKTSYAQASAAIQPVLKPEDVQIDRQLVAAYDAVTRMPGGEPVRFRCQEWVDEVVLRDSARGVQIEQRTPRFEIVAAKLETY